MTFRMLHLFGSIKIAPPYCSSKKTYTARISYTAAVKSKNGNGAVSKIKDASEYFGDDFSLAIFYCCSFCICPGI